MGVACSSSEVTPEMISQAIKKFLRTAAENAESKASRPGSFAENEKIKVSPPESAQAFIRFLYASSQAEDVVKLEKKLNSVAERMCHDFSEKIIDAIEKLEISDENAEKLLRDQNPSSCTEFFKVQCRTDLEKILRSAAEPAMVEYEVPALVQAISESLKQKMANAAKLMESQGLEGKNASDAMEGALGMDLNGDGKILGKAVPAEKKDQLESALEEHVVFKCSHALLYFMAEEESKIRHEPSEASADIIRNVFSKYSVQCSVAPEMPPATQSGPAQVVAVAAPQTQHASATAPPPVVVVA